MIVPYGVEGACFALRRGCVSRVRADLDEFLSPIGMLREEIDLEALGGLYIADRRAAPRRFVENRRFEGVPRVRSPAGIEGVDQTGIRRVQLPRVGVASSLRFRRDRDGRDDLLTDIRSGTIMVP